MTDYMIQMRDALLAAAEQFARYGDYHLAKNPPDREKAATNIEWAARGLRAPKRTDGRDPAHG